VDLSNKHADAPMRYNGHLDILCLKTPSPVYERILR